MAKFDTSKIKDMTNNLVAYDLMKGRYEMKKIKFKHFTYVFVSILVLVIGTFSVDALTDNSISEKIKDAFKVKINDKEYNAKCDKTANGNMKCEIGADVTGNGDVSFEIDKDYIDKIDVTGDSEGTLFTIKATAE